MEIEERRKNSIKRKKKSWTIQTISLPRKKLRKEQYRSFQMMWTFHLFILCIAIFLFEKTRHVAGGQGLWVCMCRNQLNVVRYIHPRFYSIQVSFILLPSLLDGIRIETSVNAGDMCPLKSKLEMTN